ncbi:MAG TPA: hypothetical protein VF039_13890 [Longimicrobiales bacterium]
MRGTVRNGAVAGLVAAAAVALFFLLVDLFAGEPLRTPAYLAGRALGLGETEQAGVGFIALYTLLHFGVFVAVGVFVAWMLDRMRVPPFTPLGLVVGVLLFDLTFYGALLTRGVDILAYLGWPAFLAGNLLGGLVLMGWLDWRDERTVTFGELLRGHRVVREGIIAGLIGAVVVALWFLIVDVTSREFFFTPAALGSAVFHGARGVGEVEITPFTVAGYTLLHIGAFLLVGLLAAALATHAERHGVLLLAGVLLFVTFETLFLGLTAIAASWLLAALNGWTILGANLIAAVAMGWYLWRAHPGLRTQIGRDVEESEFGRRPMDSGVTPAATQPLGRR